MSTYIGQRYKLIKLIGTGGMANVYLALDTILNREVAIKILKDEMAKDSVAIERFQREARSSACLVHPNIVEIYDVGDDNNSHYIVMEYIKGYTLKKLIEVRGAIPYKESIWLIKQLALALLEAHKNGIIHRDVKSQNVLIKDDGTVKMADFGIAQAVNDIELTHYDTIVGSVHYLAPELTKGEAASMQSDIYSLGIVLFEMLVGKLPFSGDSAVSIALQHVNKEIPSIRSINRDIPQSIENIVIKATAKNLNNRYSNMALLISDLNECLNNSHSSDKRVSFSNNSEGTINLDMFDKNDNKEIKVQKGSKLVNKFGVIGLVCLTILSVVALVVLLLISGVIGKETVDPNTIVPDITKISVTEADDLLDKYDLKIDYSSIERIMTDNVKEGLIISCDPDISSQVQKGTKVKLVVSKGIYSKLDNYVGLNIDEVKQSLDGTYIKANYVQVDSDLPQGQVVSQSLSEGYKYDSDKILEVTFEYSRYKEINLGVGEYKGRNVDEVYDELTEKGAIVDKLLTEKFIFTQDQQSKYGPNVVINITPDEGSTYVQGSDNTIKLYYYIEE